MSGPTGGAVLQGRREGLPVLEPATGEATVLLLGNPNAGKTTLFNQLTGLRAKTANFPGTTLEHRVARVDFDGRAARLVDLPGLYSLGSVRAEERIADDALHGRLAGEPLADAVILVLDATHIQRNLFLASQVLQAQRPTVVVLNLADVAQRSGVSVDREALERELGCPVVLTDARRGTGLDELRERIGRILSHHEGMGLPIDPAKSPCLTCGGCQFAARHRWAADVHGKAVREPADRLSVPDARTRRVDAVLTHPLVGMVLFGALMFGLFYLIFDFANYPMDLIDGGIGALQVWLVSVLPEGLLSSLLVEGMVGGVGAVVVFLPQIAILFSLLSLLEDSGYLARAAFVLERPMRAVGLPGKAFVPMLSAHACAIPAVMATRAIDSRRERLMTIMVLPLLSCSARLPVYTMLIGLLVGGNALLGASLMAGAYALGIVAAFMIAGAFRLTVLRGRPDPLVLELPDYRWPSLRNALLTTWDRAKVFLIRAGSIILVLSMVIWAAQTFPQVDPPESVVVMLSEADGLEASGQAEAAEELRGEAEELTATHALENSFAGMAGRTLEPVFAPLGYDWRITVGVLASFAAREVFASTTAIMFGAGADAADEEPERLQAVVAGATRPDGSVLFTPAVCVSLLIFFALAMQCISTVAVVRRETGGWAWPLAQVAYMSALAYGLAWAGYELTLLVT